MPERASDWESIERSPAFRRLTQGRKGLVVPATAFFAAVFLGAMCLFAFAPDAMGEPAIGSITWALVVGTVMVLITFAIGLPLHA